MEFLPYVETFESEAYRAKPLLRGLDDSQEWAVKQLLAQLEELHAQISQMKLKMTGMTGEVKKILTDNNAENKSSIPATPMFKAENTDDYEDNGQNSDDAISGHKDTGQSQSRFAAVNRQTEQYTDIPPTSMQTQKTKSCSKKCYICGEKINSRFYHMQKYHPGEQSFPCKLCHMAFDDYKMFQSHIKTHEGSCLLKCDLCNRTLKSRQGMLEHMISHNGEKPFTCDVCGKSFRCKTSLATCTHGRISRGVCDRMKYRSGFQCKTCGKHFDTLDSSKKSGGEWLNSDVSSKTSSTAEDYNSPCAHSDIQKRFFCNFCPKSYAEGRKLQQHMNIHIGVQLYKCDLCGEKFFTAIAKKRHVYEKHSGEFPGFKCKICGQMCRSILGRETHYLNHTSEERNMYNIVIKMSECDICGKTVRRNELTNHKLVHSSEDSFICEVCGKGFKLKASLKKHVLVHMNPEDRPLTRPRFSQPSQRLQRCQPRQKRIVKGEKLHRCDTCLKYFSSRQSLQNHEVVHTKVKAFKCEICELSFTLPGNLKRHYNIHTGQKPFQCDFCGKGFVQKTSLDIHRRIHTGERPYQCNLCGKRFSDPSTLHKHRNKHEKDSSYHLQSL